MGPWWLDGGGGVAVINYYTIGRGTRGAEGATAPPDFKIYAFAPPPPDFSTPVITHYWLEIILKHVAMVISRAYDLHAIFSPRDEDL